MRFRVQDVGEAFGFGVRVVCLLRELVPGFHLEVASVSVKLGDSCFQFCKLLVIKRFKPCRTQICGKVGRIGTARGESLGS